MSSEQALPLVPPAKPRRRALGDPTPLACTVAKAAVDAVLGGAALDAYVRWIEPDLFASLARQHSLARRAGIRPEGAVGVRRARVCRVARDAAEVSIVIEHAGRCRAVAMRLEDSRGRWLIVGLQIG